MNHAGIGLIALAMLWGIAATAVAAEPTDPKSQAEEILAAAGVQGGLCVHLGCGDGRLTAALSGDGRFLVHGLEPDAAKTEGAIRAIRSRGLYGQVWVETLATERLPYAENLVNLLVADGLLRTNVSLQEIMRVLCPGGVACFRPGEGAPASAERRGNWLIVRKPRPPEMDEWGHPRHDASANAVSLDRLVGPPRRVRWLAGPMIESSNIVTAGGRLFHAGLVARDAFNGLPLWEGKLNPTPLRLGFPAAAMKGSVLPVAVGDRLFVVSGGKLQALDAATGRMVRGYADAGTPLEILCEAGILVSLDEGAVKAFDAVTGRSLWSQKADRPACLVAGDEGVFYLEGGSGEGGARSVARLEISAGKSVWRQASYAWAAKVRHISYHKGLLVCEVCTYADARPGNGIHVLDALSGAEFWERPYEPGQNHYMQARALQTDDRIWVLAKGQWEALDRRTGEVKQCYEAGQNHCFPPVAAGPFLLSEEMSLTEMATGVMDANRISKSACGRDAGTVPANGLLYVAPKHCTCYPMLRGFAALAPAKPVAEVRSRGPADIVPERGPAAEEVLTAAGKEPASGDEWPCYRADMWRSAGTSTTVAANVEVLWTTEIGGWPQVRLAKEWKENLFVRGPITAPVVAGGRVFVAQPDGHRLVALDTMTGKVLWDFTANGRVDTPPTITRGLCLFGTSSGWVYCLRADDGRLAWRLRAGPEEERIISFGQLESPRPVPGSILMVDGTAYFAAGRHPQADGGIRLFAVDPARGTVKWLKTVADLPMVNFYEGAALEFDCFDLLVAEARTTATSPGDKADYVTMSRWRVDLASGQMDCAWESGFGFCRTGAQGVMAPRGLWTYGPRMSYLASGPKAGEPDHVASKPRPLAAFREGAIYGSSEDGQRLWRRDFADDDVATFDDSWFSHRKIPRGTAPGDRNRAERLARGAAWSQDVFTGGAAAKQEIGAVVLAGDIVFVVGTRGGLHAFAAADGKKLATRDVPAPLWDGLAAANGRLYLSTQDGKVVCLGTK